MNLHNLEVIPDVVTISMQTLLFLLGLLVWAFCGIHKAINKKGIKLTTMQSKVLYST